MAHLPSHGDITTNPDRPRSPPDDIPSPFSPAYGTTHRDASTVMLETNRMSVPLFVSYWVLPPGAVFIATGSIDSARI